MRDSLFFKRFSIVFLVLVFASLSCSHVPQSTGAEPQDRTVDQHSVQELISTFQKALSEGNLDAYMETVAEDTIFLPNGSSQLVGKAAVRTYFEEQKLAEWNVDLRFEFDDIQFVDDVAIAAGRDVEVDRSQEGGGGQPRIYNDLHVYKEQPDSSWKQWRIMWAPAGPSQQGD